MLLNISQCTRQSIPKENDVAANVSSEKYEKYWILGIYRNIREDLKKNKTRLNYRTIEIPRPDIYLVGRGQPTLVLCRDVIEHSRTL